MGQEEAETQIQIVQSANLILNPCLMVPITAPQTSVLAEASKFKHISSVLQVFFVTDLSWDDNEGGTGVKPQWCKTPSSLFWAGKKPKINLGKYI